MDMITLRRLADLIQHEREPLLERWRAQVRDLPSARNLAAPVLTDHIPDLLDELSEDLRVSPETTIAEKVREGTPPRHGTRRLQVPSWRARSSTASNISRPGAAASSRCAAF